MNNLESLPVSRGSSGRNYHLPGSKLSSLDSTEEDTLSKADVILQFTLEVQYFIDDVTHQHMAVSKCFEYQFYFYRLFKCLKILEAFVKK